MKELLEKIAISNTDERLEKIIDILDEWDFDFKLQSTEYTFPIFDWLMLNKKFHYFDDDEINEVINDEENEIFESDFHKEYTRNLIISFNSQIIKDRIILSAHYDIVNGSMGANDNGSSIVILLKLAKYLKEKNTKLPIDIVFFDKEECGSKGCSDFIDEYKEKIKVAINLDVCGCGENIVILDECKDSDIPLNIINKAKENGFIFTDLFPYGDARMMSEKGVNNISISVFPNKDTEILKNIKFDIEIKQKLKNHENYSLTLLEAKRNLNVNFFSMELFKYMHNGIYDDIKYINFDIMNDILSFLKTVF